MKLILTHEVDGLGSPGDVVEVKDGYGRNYLLPRGFAIKWTRGAQKQIDSIRRARAAREIRSLDEAKQIAEQLGSLKVRLNQRAGDNGRLFGSVTSTDVAEAVKAAGGPEVDKRRIQIQPDQVGGRLHGGDPAPPRGERLPADRGCRRLSSALRVVARPRCWCIGAFCCADPPRAGPRPAVDPAQAVRPGYGARRAGA